MAEASRPRGSVCRSLTAFGWIAFRSQGLKAGPTSSPVPATGRRFVSPSIHLRPVISMPAPGLTRRGGAAARNCAQPEMSVRSTAEVHFPKLGAPASLLSCDPIPPQGRELGCLIRQRRRGHTSNRCAHASPRAYMGAIQTDAVTRYGAVIFVGCCHWRRRSWVGRGLSNRRSSRR